MVLLPQPPTARVLLRVRPAGTYVSPGELDMLTSHLVFASDLLSDVWSYCSDLPSCVSSGCFPSSFAGLWLSDPEGEAVAGLKEARPGAKSQREEFLTLQLTRQSRVQRMGRSRGSC